MHPSCFLVFKITAIALIIFLVLYNFLSWPSSLTFATILEDMQWEMVYVSAFSCYSFISTFTNLRRFLRVSRKSPDGNILFRTIERQFNWQPVRQAVPAAFYFLRGAFLYLCRGFVHFGQNFEIHLRRQPIKVSGQHLQWSQTCHVCLSVCMSLAPQTSLSVLKVLYGTWHAVKSDNYYIWLP